MTAVPAALATSLADRYRIVGEIARGGMATVWLADDLRYGRRVALKVMDPELAAAIGPERFRREIETVARLTHPHVIPLHDSGVAAGHLYYVMPYIAGESLRARLARTGPLPLDDALRWTREIASALAYAHRQGVVHRDVKPENVLLSEGIALVADFGIARGAVAPATPDTAATRRPAEPTGTTPGALVGTPRYMAPEQCVGGVVDGRADLYALACVLYEMLAGVPPFTAQAVEALVRQHLAETPAPVTAHRPEVPAALAGVIAQALAKDPAERPASMARFAEALAVAAAAGTTSAGPPAAEATAAPALARPRTPFIGRERELEACRRLLDETRLLTITGIGGSGKTRLALELARRAPATHAGGSAFVDLAPVQDPERVAQTVALALGVREVPGTPLVASLAAWLDGRGMLVVLDNCEHVRAAAVELIDRLLALERPPGLMATSREPLGVAGEVVYPLGSLTLPPVEATADPAAVGAAEAVRLFLDRARAVDARFALDAKTAPAVAEICRRLDGIPLALELAAARVRVLTVEQIRDRLDDRFRLLGGAGRGAPARQETLRAVIQWSYDAAVPADQRLLRVLSVFAGGWTLAGATRVAGAGAGADADEFQVLDGLTHLADKSLVGMSRAGSEARYAMLETVRQFAGERLRESAEEEEARSRHLAFVLALAEEAAPRLLGPAQKAWLHRLDQERENLLLAHAWCDRVATGGPDGLRLVHALVRYWVSGGLLPLGYRVTLQALARPGAGAPTPLRGHALVAAGQLGFFVGQYAEARGFLEESLAILRERDDPQSRSTALRALGAVAMAQGDLARARASMEEAIALARGLDDRLRLGVALSHLGELERAEGRFAEARPLYEEALAVSRELENQDNIAVNLLNLALLAVGRRDVAAARAQLREALEIAVEIGSRYSGQAVIEVTAALAATLGEWTRAARYDGTSEALRETMGVRREPADEAFFAPLLERTAAALGAEGYAAARAGGRALGYEAAIAEAREWLAGG